MVETVSLHNGSTSASLTAPAKLAKKKIEVSSAQQYADVIAAHAELSINQSLYPGENFESLAEYLQRPYSLSEGVPFYPRSVSTPFASLLNLTVPQNSERRVRSFLLPEALGDALDRAKAKTNPKPSILLFLNGYPSPEWLNIIGWKCNIDPEFFRRHLIFRTTSTERDYFTLPALPSTSKNIIKLRVANVGFRQHQGAQTQVDVERLRKSASEKMETYATSLKRETNVEIGDSIVRSFSVHDTAHFSFEQDVSICVNSFGQGWLGLVWLDTGTDLSRGPSGPWSSPLLKSHSWKTSINPTIPHRPNIALKTFYIARREPRNPNIGSKFPQSISLLHTQYGRFLQPDTAANDAFYSLSELFAFMASAESQFLNMIKRKIDIELDLALSSEDNASDDEAHIITLSNLLYNKKILDEHVKNLKDNISTIKSRGGRKWPRAVTETQAAKVTATADALLKDFEHLFELAETLSQSCDRGINIAGNNAMVAESRRAIMQAKYVSKLTLLAFFYIPASFTTSLFGMNVKQFGQGTLNIYVWISTLVPLYVVTILILYFNDSLLRWTSHYWSKLGFLRKQT